MTRADEVPVVMNAHLFVCAEAERLKAMEDAQHAATDEERLEHALVVTNLYQKQAEQLNETVLPDLQSSNDREQTLAIDWVRAWSDAAKSGLEQWADYQKSLVAKVGRDRAEEIAQGRPTERVQAVIDAAKERVKGEARAAGIDVDQYEQGPTPPVSDATPVADTKTCPDCAEEVKAAARKCRYCGHRFDA